jgi:hypothetical protein
VNEGQLTTCPRCGSGAQVHSISELADLARLQLSQMQQAGGQQQAGQAGPQQGWEAEPQAGPMPGYGRQPQAGPFPGRGQGGNTGVPGFGMPDSIGDAVADLAMGAAGAFIGRAIGRRVQRAMTERVLPAMANSGANRQAMLQQQIAVAERYPDLRACMTDKVVFLADGSATAPMPNLATVTLQQADALVAQLRQG